MPIILGQNRGAGGSGLPPRGSHVGAGPAAGDAGAIIIDVDIATFETEVLHRSLKTPIVVDLWAPWCGPCKALGPLLEKICKEYNGGFVLAKVDVDANQEIAAAFGARSIPMVVLIKNGQPVDAFTGALPEADIRKWLGRHVKPAAAPAEAPAGAVESPAERIGAGDPRGALELLKGAKDPALELKAAVLAGDSAHAQVVRAAMSPADRDALGTQLEAIDRILAALVDVDPALEGWRSASTAGRLPEALEALLANFGETTRPLLVDHLALMGRGPVADEIRGRLAKLVFR